MSVTPNVDDAGNSGVALGRNIETKTEGEHLLAEVNTLSPHSGHYYADGNFVIVAENTKFKLFKSVLAQHSGVFRDMFAIVDGLGQSHIDGGLVVDGLPAVRWQDPSDDIAHLLDTLIPPIPWSTPPDMRKIYTIIKLADKYDFQPTYRQAVNHLLERYPKTQSDLSRDRDLKLYDDLTTAAYLIRCSRSIHDQSAMPLAFYALATKDWSAMTLEDQDIVIGALSAEDQARVHFGKAKLIRMVADAVEDGATIKKITGYSRFTSELQTTQIPWHCGGVGELARCRGRDLGFTHPLKLSTLLAEPLSGTWQMMDTLDEFCVHCNSYRRKFGTSLRENILSSLVVLFNL